MVVEQAVPHSHVVGGSGEGYLGSKVIVAAGQTAQPRVSVLGRLIPLTSVCKNKWGLGWGKELPGFQETRFRGPAQS